MKKITLGLLLLTSVLFVSCGGGQKEKIAGEWKLTNFTDKGEPIELTECDKQTTWNFTKEGDEALADGTQVQKLIGSAPEECEYYSFDSKWTVQDGKLFVSTSRIGGMGGSSFAGLMEIVELSDTKMVLRTFKKEITLEK